MRVDRYQAPGYPKPHDPDSELYGEIWITNPTNKLKKDPLIFYPLFILSIDKVQQGDIVQAHCQFQVTLHTHHKPSCITTALGHAMSISVDKVTRQEYSNFPPNSQWLEPARKAGENVIGDVHHGFRSLVGSITIDNKISDHFKDKIEGPVWITVWIWAVSGAAEFKVSKLFIGNSHHDDNTDTWSGTRGYGGLSALVFRNSL